MGAPQKPRRPGSLKEACAHLVERCGGQKAVAGLWHCTAQNVARMTDSDSAQNPPRLDQILMLEALCKEPIVSGYAVSLLNCIVEPIDCGPTKPLAFVMGNITKETGEMLSAAAQSVAAGSLSATNAATVLRETDDVVRGLVQVRAACREVLNQEAI